MKLRTMPLRFRVWDKKEKRFLLENADLDEYASLWAGAGVGGESEVISQDTGLKDKIGKNIYTGDIVEKRYSNDDDFNGVRAVCFYDANAAEVDFELVHGSDDVKNFIEEYTVVGNIFENSGLLEE